MKVSKTFRNAFLSIGLALTMGISSAVAVRSVIDNSEEQVQAATDYSACESATTVSSLWTAVTAAAASGYSAGSYASLWTWYWSVYQVSSSKLFDYYSTSTNFTSTSDQCGNYSAEGDCYNREHSIPKSWWGGSTSNQGCDIFIVVPTDGYVNNQRSAYCFGEVATATYTSKSGCKLGTSTSTYGYTGGSTKVFEPTDDLKGDFARIYFYAMAKWPNVSMNSSEGAYFFASSTTKNASTNYGFTDYGKKLMYAWHKADPVSSWEQTINTRAAAKQGNRNPFIDHPEYADYIWGGVAIGSSTSSSSSSSQQSSSSSISSSSTASTGTGGSITYSDLATAYETTATSHTSSSGNIGFKTYNCANYSSKMQWKKNGGYLYTTTSLNLTTIKINDIAGNGTLTVYGTNTAGSTGTTITGSSGTYNLSGYKYFYIINNSDAAVTASSITVNVSSGSSSSSSSSSQQSSSSSSSQQSSSSSSSASSGSGDTYTLVTSTSGLTSGSKYAIANVSSGSGYAMSSTQNTNNRGQTAITVSSSKFTAPSDMEEFTLGGSSGSWTLYANNSNTTGYLYVPSNNNYLRTQSSTATWSIGISSNVATITDPTYSRVIKYNSGSSIFSAYASTSSMASVYLYKNTSSSTTTKTLSSISVNTSNATTSYYVGDTFSSSGLVVTATYSDNSSATVTGWTTTTPTMTSAGSKTVTVSYTEGGVTKTATYSITVTAVTLSSIAVTTNPTKTSYYVGDTFSSSGLVVTATYNNGSTSVVTSSCSLSSPDMSTAGTKTITVTYSSKTTSFTITVSNPTLSSITVTGMTTSYTVGDTFSFDGTCTAYYNNSTSKTVTPTSVSSPSMSSSGTKTITVSYTENAVTQSTTYQITVTAAAVTLSSISVNANNAKTSYFVGDSFSYSGLVITATYSDSTTSTITPSDCTYSGYNMSSAGNQTVTVSYGGKTATYSITVTAIALSSISIEGYTTSFTVGDTFSFGGTVTATYNNSSTADVTASATFTGYDMSTAGNQTVTVSYGGKTASYQITVTSSGSSAGTSTDTLTRDSTGVTSGNTAYEDWTYTASSGSGAVYAGNSAGSYDSIQLRSKNSTSGIITTTSGGKIKSVTVAWESNTASGRTLNVYGSNTAYSQPSTGYGSPLYSSSTYGDLLGTIVYGTNTSLSISEDYAYVGVRSNSGAMYLSSISFEWSTSSSTITEPTLESIAVSSSPSNTSYYVGDTFDSTGLSITASYSDGSSAAYTDYSLSSPDMSTSGTKTITVTSNEDSSITTTFTITVQAVTLSSLTVISNPTKTSYYTGDAFDSTGLVIRATYNNGSTNENYTNYTLSSPNMSNAGSKTVTVTSKDNTNVSTSFTISVTALAVTSISISGYTTEFTTADTFSFGGVVTANYNNGSTADVTSSASFSGYDLSTAGTQTITVTYSGKTATYQITVTNANGEPAVTASDKYRLVTSAEDLDTSSTYLIASGYSGSINIMDSANSYTNVSSNYVTASVSATVDSNSMISLPSSLNDGALTIGGSSGNYTISHGSYYLRSYSSSNYTDCYFSTGTSYNKFSISIADGGATTITSNTTSSTMAFSSYFQLTTSSTNVYLFKKVNDSYTASLYSADLLSALNGVCNANGSTSASSLAAAWRSLNSKFLDMPMAQREFLKSLEANPSGSDLEKAMAKYDYIVSKYGASTYGNFIGRDIANNAKNVKALGDTSEAENNIWVLLVAGVAISSVGALIISKRKKRAR